MLGAAAFPVLSLANVKDGVDAWDQGDFAKAIHEWAPLAAAGDADAQFNMGQACKLGRGVRTDFTKAIDYFRKAALQGHERAIDNLGLLLFQQGQRGEAMLWLTKSAKRGEARAQYLVGLALFNGDLIPKNWTKAYALMLLAQQQGLTQADEALKKMDSYIPQDQRMAGITLAGQMEHARQNEVRTADAVPPKLLLNAPSEPQAAQKPQSKAATASPAPPSATPTGNWRIQLGAFSEAARAEALWKSLRTRVNALAGYQHFLVSGGAVTRLQAGPFESRDEAGKLCFAIRAASADCIVKSM
jgi:cell division septation protein DedD